MCIRFFLFKKKVQIVEREREKKNLPFRLFYIRGVLGRRGLSMLDGIEQQKARNNQAGDTLKSYKSNNSFEGSQLMMAHADRVVLGRIGEQSV